MSFCRVTRRNRRKNIEKITLRIWYDLNCIIDTSSASLLISISIPAEKGGEKIFRNVYVFVNICPRSSQLIMTNECITLLQLFGGWPDSVKVENEASKHYLSKAMGAVKGSLHHYHCSFLIQYEWLGMPNRQRNWSFSTPLHIMMRESTLP